MTVFISGGKIFEAVPEERYSSCSGCAFYNSDCDEANTITDDCRVVSTESYCAINQVIWKEKSEVATEDTAKYPWYIKDISHLDKLDIYRVLELYEVTDPALQHAAKKILVAGRRGAKDIEKDIQEVIDTCIRWQEMQKENNQGGVNDKT